MTIYPPPSPPSLPFLPPFLFPSLSSSPPSPPGVVLLEFGGEGNVELHSIPQLPELGLPLLWSANKEGRREGGREGVGREGGSGEGGREGGREGVGREGRRKGERKGGQNRVRGMREMEGMIE